MVSLLASFVLSFFPLDVLDEIWDLIESVSEGFLTYSYYTLIAKVNSCINFNFYITIIMLYLSKIKGILKL